MVSQTGLKHTFNNIRDIVWPVSKARKVLVNSNTSLEFASQQVAFVQEQNKLRFC